MRAICGLLVAAAAAAAIPRTARSQQPLRLSYVGGELGLQAHGSSSRIPLARSVSERGFLEWVDMRVRGSFLDPRLLQLDATLRPTWVQGISGVDGRREEDGGVQVNYSVDARLLSAGVAPVSLRARRFAGDRLRGFGPPRDFDISEAGVRLDLRWRALPVSVDAKVRSRFERWAPETAMEPYRDESQRALRLRARNSKLQAGVEWYDHDDRLSGRSFGQLVADARHWLRWGKRSSLATSVSTLRRSRSQPLERTTWGEHVHLQHTWSVGSDWQFEQVTVRTVGEPSVTRSARSLMHVLVGRGLTARVGGRRIWRSFPTARRNEIGAVPSLSLETRLPNGSAQISVSVGYERLWQESLDGVASVVGEVHVVDASGRVTLRERFPDPETLVVTDVGSALVFAEGLDFLVERRGDQLDLWTLPTGRLAAGDTVLVDYAFRVLPDAESEGIVASYSVDVGWRGLHAYARQDVRNHRNGTAYALLLPRQDLAVGAGVTEQAGWLSGGVRGEYRRYTYDDELTQVVSVHGSAQLQPATEWTVRVTGSALWMRGTHTANGNAQGQGTVHWTPNGTIRLTAHGEAWRLTSDVGDGRTFLGGGAEAEWRVGLTELSVRFDRGQVRDGRVQGLNRFYVHLTRRF